MEINFYLAKIWRPMLRRRLLFPCTSAALSAGMRRADPLKNRTTRRSSLQCRRGRPGRASRNPWRRCSVGAHFSRAPARPYLHEWGGAAPRRNRTTQPRHREVPRKPMEYGLKGAASWARVRQRSSLQFCFLPLLNMRELTPMDTLGRRHPTRQDLREICNRPAIVFLTVCTKSKKQILANEAVHNTLREAWKAADSWLVGRYVIMPDHLHLFCSPAMNTSAPLIQWVSFWKSHTDRNWPKREDAPVWQRNFWDTQLRKEESYAEKWQYVVEHPVRAGLVTGSSDWPYQGEMHELNW